MVWAGGECRDADCRVQGRQSVIGEQEDYCPLTAGNFTISSLMKSLSFVFFLLSIFLPLHNASAGEIYQWFDKNGVIHFGQAPPSAGGAKKIELTQPATNLSPEDSHSPVAREKSPPSVNRPLAVEAPPTVREERSPVVNPTAAVEMFATSWCGYCRKAREYFQARGIPLIEYDIEVDVAAAQRKQQIDTHPGVPLVVINGQLIHGFAPAMYERALSGRP